MEISQTADNIDYIPIETLTSGHEIYGVIDHIGDGLIHDPTKPISNPQTGEITYNHFLAKCVYVREFNRTARTIKVNYYCAVMLLGIIEPRIESGSYKTYQDVGEGKATKVKIVFKGWQMSHTNREYSKWEVFSNADKQVKK